MNQVATHEAMAEMKRRLGRPVRRESVERQVLNGREIMTLIYSAFYRGNRDNIPDKRVYRVALFDGKRLIADTILDSFEDELDDEDAK